MRGSVADLAPLDIEAVLLELEAALTRGCTAEKLHALITLLDDETFVPELRRVLRNKDNQAAGLYGMRNAIRRCMRLAERQRDRSDTHGRIVQATAVGGGSAMIVGGIVSLLNPVIGMIALVPVAAGLVILGVSSLGVGRLDGEKSGYKQLAERLAEIDKELRASQESV